ncbi:hypothetical protein QWY85_18995 [Neolewinella lacunae]|uniref:Outer membrane protein beta-barrel domain-containing protein n=1 Tax=Neolewinella lacunae TaxID=1517758 RepID=A0A923PP38_9BACT|nr:hypothetical protein [Neolewinella lacunae]MBC6994087.1 hypothetical protein [Neolewinella lacunae]MDN3636764.1 hypothetical protein [Neolewinella lacunae]
MFNQLDSPQMKKTILITLTLLAIATGLDAQGKRGYLGISLGPSIPIGVFASQDDRSEEAGFGEMGAMLDLSLVYQLGKGNYGITAMLRGQLNPFDDEVRYERFNEILDIDFDYDVESGSWGVRTAMLGGFGSVPFSDKLSFYVRVMAGIVSATSPKIEAVGNSRGITILTIERSSATASAFGQLYGGGFTFDLGNKLCLTTNLDYFTAEPEFSNVVISISEGATQTRDVSQKIRTLNFSVGLGLKF